MYSDILYPTDGSDGATAALDNVRDVVETYDATVHVLYVVDTTHTGLGSDPDREESPGMIGHPEGGDGGMVGVRATTEELQETLKEEGERVVEAVRSELSGVDVETVVRTGDPHEAILDYAEAADIDLIVMGTHGRTGLDRYLIGSVTEKIVRLSDTPVMTIRADGE
jgi:nucleotide-binding universal stress UspA family protein